MFHDMYSERSVKCTIFESMEIFSMCTVIYFKGITTLDIIAVLKFFYVYSHPAYNHIEEQVQRFTEIRCFSIGFVWLVLILYFLWHRCGGIKNAKILPFWRYNKHCL